MKKTVSLLLSICIMTSLAACGGGQTPSSESGREPSGASSSDAAVSAPESAPESAPKPAGTHAVVDFRGNETQVPDSPERIVVLGPLPLPTVLTAFQEGYTGNIVGVAPDSVNGAEHTIFSRYAPDFTSIAYEFYNGGQLNMEELVKLKPDVVFYMGAEMAELFEQAGIAAVEFAHPSSGGAASPLLTLKSWMDTIEQVLQKTSPAQEIIAYGEGVEAEIISRIAASPDQTPQKLLFLSNYTDSAIAAMGKKSFGQYWSELVGGENLGSRPTSGQVNMEQIYEWSPDQIFIMTFSDKTPDDIYNSTVDGHDWSGIPATVNKKVFKFPFGMHRWCPPTTDTPLAMWWVAKQARPDLFEDIDMNKKIKEYYQQFYAMTLTDEDVEWILNPRPETKRMAA